MCQQGQAAISKKAAALTLRPLNDFRCTLNDNGCVRTYTDAAGKAKVAIYWTAASGAHTVDLKHSIYKTYRDAKFENGKYGYPVLDMTVRSDKSATQRFQSPSSCMPTPFRPRAASHKLGFDMQKT